MAKRVAASSRVETSQRASAYVGPTRKPRRKRRRPKRRPRKKKNKKPTSRTAPSSRASTRSSSPSSRVCSAVTPSAHRLTATPSQHFDDDDVKKSGFDLPYDAEKTALTKEEWDGALAEINGVFNHTGIMAVLCCLCGDPEVPTRRGNSV